MELVRIRHTSSAALSADGGHTVNPLLVVSLPDQVVQLKQRMQAAEKRAKESDDRASRAEQLLADTQQRLAVLEASLLGAPKEGKSES